jgi:hypothetical protein
VAAQREAAIAMLLGLCHVGAPKPANAAPGFVYGLDTHAPVAELINDYRWRPPIYKKGRPPIYPYYYKPPGPRGWEFYMGFVPYKKGDYATQALQRSQYPDTMAWPPGMDVWPEPDTPPLKKRRR